MMVYVSIKIPKNTGQILIYKTFLQTNQARHSKFDLQSVFFKGKKIVFKIISLISNQLRLLLYKYM